MDMGVGKSKIACDEFVQLYLERSIDRVLIVAGAGSYGDWTEKHLPENLPPDVPVKSHMWRGGKRKAEIDSLKYLLDDPPALRVLTMNIEALSMSKDAMTVAENFVRGGRTLFVVDESTKIKDEDSIRTKAAIRLGKLCVVRRIMTGSPVTKSPLDLWSQMKFLGVHEDFAENYYGFRARFCELVQIRTGMGKPTANGAPAKSKYVFKVVGARNLDVLERRLARHSYRVLKEECLDLPPKTYRQQPVELTPEQARLYGDMAKLASAELEGGVWSSSKNAMDRLTKLHQIILGHLVDESGDVHGIPTNRPKALGDLVEEMGDKVIIWCAYRRDVTLVLQELERRFPTRRSVRYDGLCSADQRAAAKVNFQEGDAHCFVGTAATGGMGITLTASSNVIYYSNNFNLEHRLQSEDRCHRDGQTRPVLYTDMITPRTVEERIVENLRGKKTIADAVNGDGVREWLRYLK
jgi:SNF2 family DNA or RNA helicase